MTGSSRRPESCARWRRPETRVSPIASGTPNTPTPRRAHRAAPQAERPLWLADVVAKKGDVVFAAFVGRLADDRCTGCLDDRHQQLGIDLAGADVGMTVGA